MAELSVPFNSTSVDGEEDRLYEAKDIANMLKQFLSNGVYPNPSSGLRVDASGTSMVLTVREGSAIINGHTYVLFEEPKQFALSPSHMNYNRKDAIVVQLNHTERAISMKYKEGAPASNPIVPALVRTDDIYEIRIAEILVKTGVKQITQAEVTDTRLDKSLCGMVTHVITSVDTTAIFNQYQTYLNQQIAAWNATKAKQGTDWQGQMTAQQQTFTAKSNEIDAWYSDVRTNIAKLQAFDFDNLCSVPGCTRVTVKNSNGYVETIKNSSNSKKVAERTTVKTGANYTETIKVFEEDGVIVMKSFVITMVKTANGYEERVVG